MTLRSIRLHNVRRFTDPVAVRGISPGLNVLAAPNEHGKSTIFDALHAVFFRDRKSFDKQIRSLVPHAGGSPQVAVEIEHDGGIYRIEKTWKRTAGTVRVMHEGSVFRQADEAEGWIKSVLKAPESGGPAGLLWVRQGQAGLHRQSKQESKSTQMARRNLLTSVANEVDAMTGGHRMEVARSKCRDELALYNTGSGRVKRGGALASKRQEKERLEKRHSELKGLAVKLRTALGDRRRLRRELRDLVDPRAVEVRTARLDQAEQAHAEALRHADQLERARDRERAKQMERDRMRERCNALLRDVLELTEASEEHATATTAHKAASQHRVEEQEKLNALKQRLEEATRLAEQAETVRRQAQVEAQRQERSELAGKLARAEEARQAAEAASADETREVTARAADQLEQHDSQVRELRRLRDREAASLTMSYLPGKAGAVRHEESVLEDGVRVSVPDGAILDIDGVGRLVVHPGQRVDSTSLEEAEAKLKALLLGSGMEDISEVRASLRRRRKAEERRRDAEALLRGIAPRGIAALREKLAALPEPTDAGEEGLPLAQAQALEDEARGALRAATQAFEQQRNRYAEAEKRLTLGAAGRAAAEARQDRAQAALRGLESPEEEVRRREEACERLSRELEGLAQLREAKEKTAPNLTEAESRLGRARSVIERSQAEEHRLQIELGKLDTTIETQAGSAVEEELADILERLGKTREELQAIEFEVEVLKALDKELAAAQKAARDRFVQPVLTELKPLLRLLWPDAKIRFDAENVLPETLVRAGTEEDFNVLSGGTQEQIAILVRLAFAQILAKSGSPAPAILDDAIVFTDDDRIEAMFDALTQQARELQIIVLSCRQRAFRELGGTSLHIEPVAET